MIDPVANEAALRFLANENNRLTLMLAQAKGNLALANKRVAELEASADQGILPDSEPEEQ